jgi:hypothetical protein
VLTCSTRIYVMKYDLTPLREPKCRPVHDAKCIEIHSCSLVSVGNEKIINDINQLVTASNIN